MDRNAGYYCMRTSHGDRIVCYKYSDYLRVRSRHSIDAIQLVTNSSEEAHEWYQNFIDVMQEDRPQALVCGYNKSEALRLAFTHPRALQSRMNKDDSFEVVWDSGASCCITFDKQDFVGPIKSVHRGAHLTGIVSGLKIEGVGTVNWSIIDTNGAVRSLLLPCYYVPRAQQRLLSTAAFSQKYPNNRIVIGSPSWHIEANPDDEKESAMDVYLNQGNNLPMSTCFRTRGVESASAAMAAEITVLNEENANLSAPEKELLRWHVRLGHVGFRKVQHIMRMGVLATSQRQRRLHTAAAKISEYSHLPKCAACQYAKQTSRPVPGKKRVMIRDKAGILSAGKEQPGERVHMDHFVSSTRGRLFTGYGANGKSRHVKSFCGGCIFVDAATGFVHCELQQHLNNDETLEAVKKFEQVAADSGITIAEYSADNGSCFTSKAFAERLQAGNQAIRHSGAGSHHQNGCAERSIRTIMAIARTLLLHAAIHWPDVADPTLWPMSVYHACYIWNRIPNESSGVSPLDLWTKTRQPLSHLLRLHVFGCPVYVLDKRIADGKKIGRWVPRSYRGIYLGHSPKHSSDVPLVLNLSTGSITPQ